MRLSTHHFYVANEDTAQLIFKQSVKLIELEVSSYCNRRCSYCPNSFIDRISNKNYMTDKLFYNIMSQLSSIDYSGKISLHRYNEPLADREYALSRISECHKAIPNANIQIYTNGDYLTKDYVEDIYAAGCKNIICNLHLTSRNNAQTREDAVKKAIERIGLPHMGMVSTNNLYGGKIIYRDMDFHLFCRAFDGEQVLSRAGAIEIEEPYRRTSPCFRPFIEVQIEVDGTLLPCCEVRSDVPEHGSCVLGRLGESDNLFEAWADASWARFRRLMASFKEKPDACGKCNSNIIPDTAETRDVIRQMRSLFE